MIDKLERMLKAQDLSDTEIRERLQLIDRLQYGVGVAIEEMPNFKGLEVYGSILNGKFNGDSDIDVSLVFGSEDRGNGDAVVRNILEKSTKRRIHDAFNWNEGTYTSIRTREPSTETGWSFFVPAFYGVFVGDESYRVENARNILQIIKAGSPQHWDIIKYVFDSWGHKDLTNPSEDFSLSGFQKACKDYGVK